MSGEVEAIVAVLNEFSGREPCGCETCDRWALRDRRIAERILEVLERSASSVLSLEGETRDG